MHYRLFLVGFALLVLPLGAANPEPYPGLSRKWAYYQSPNFELYSANREGESRMLLEKLELVRALFLEAFQLKVRMPQPVTIFYFDRKADFNGYLPPNFRGSKVDFAGFCLGYEDRTVITMAPTWSSDAAKEIIYHEYIHYLFRITEQSPAPWFNEGVAELFSTMEDNPEWLILGQPVLGRVIDLRRGKMMPFEQLFAMDYTSDVFRNSGHTGIFYAQSWAFLHYCRFGVNKIPPEKMAMFLRAAGSSLAQERPAEFRALTEELLGTDLAKLQRELDNYITSGRFIARKAPRPTIPAKTTYLVRPAPPEEMQERLTELSLRVTRSPYANLAIRAMLAKAPTVRLHELMGMVAQQEGEAQVAREQWQQAVELGTTNAAIYRELALIESNLVFSQFNPDYRLPEVRAARLRELLHKSIASAPEQSMGYEMLAWVEASAAKPDVATVLEVQKRFATLNDKPRTLLALVMVRLRLGQKEDAIKLLDQLDQLKPNPWALYFAEIIRARAESRPVDESKRPAVEQRRYLQPLKFNLPH